VSEEKLRLLDHLQSGAATVCQAWPVLRADGVGYGFTDHDRDLTFDGLLFKASSGLTASALSQGTGLSVDNAEAMGALSDAAITGADVLAGRFDDAEVRIWLVNWADVSARMEQFRGSFGEISRAGGAFRAELRGLAEALNRPQGRVYHKSCPAVLGDGHCGFDLSQEGFSAEVAVVSVDADGRLQLPVLSMPAGWFERGRLRVLSGAAVGLVGVVKFDLVAAGARVVELWTGLAVTLAAGDLVRLEAGCDKTADTCRAKFNNFMNFRGFPHLPGEDWLTSYPVTGQALTGGSLSP
jgi:uncharacterized phage protein (TIGR02218 family)